MSVRDKWGRKDLRFFYDNLVDFAEILTTEQLGELVKKTLEFTIDGTIYERDDFNDSGLYLAYKQTCNLQSNLGEKYSEKIEKLTENGRKGGEAKSNKNKQLLANATVKVKEKVKEKEKEKDKDTVDSFSWFDSLWELYPLRRGKDKITDDVLAELEAVGEDTLRECIKNYESDRADNPTRATMNGSTFFLGRYKDYLPGVYEPMKRAPSAEEKKAKTVKENNRGKLAELKREYKAIQAELDGIDRKQDRDRYHALRDKETFLEGQIAKLEQRLEPPMGPPDVLPKKDPPIDPFFRHYRPQ